MAAELIDGKTVANGLRKETRAIIESRLKEGKPRPGLAVILVGDDPASTIYVRNKRLACEEVGIHSIYHALPSDMEEKKLIDLIQTLNSDKSVNGILLQLPLPAHMDTDKVLETIDPYKDVDGFHPYNIGRLAQRHPLLRPCTPQGIMILLDHIKQPCQGQHAVIVGASNIVGRPMALELLMAGATVTICHSLTKDLPSFVAQADILVSAVGNPGMIKGTWIKSGSTVIDVGITRLSDGTITGDIEFEPAKQRARWITPVPGGVGPMTVAVLLRNTVLAADYHSQYTQKEPR